MRRRNSAVVAALVLLGLVVGCRQADDPRAGRGAAAVDTVEGVVVVANHPEGAWLPGEEWAVREVFRAGSVEAEDGIAFSGTLLSASLGPGGQIAVLDFLVSEVTFLTADGALLKKVARSGPGPGELANPSAMAWDDEGRLWVADGFSGRYSVFDTSGAFLETVPRPIRSLARRQHPLLIDSTGMLIDEGASDGAIQFLRVSHQGDVVDTLASLSHPPRPGFGRGLVLLPHHQAIRYVLRNYRPALRWAVAADGTVWLTRSDDLTLFNLDLETGDTLRVVHTSHRDADLTDEDEEAIQRGLAEVGIPRRQVELRRPVVQALYATSDGYLLAQIVEEVGEDGTAFDVFDGEGVFLGTFGPGFGIRDQTVPTFIGDTIVAVSRGPLDVPQIVRATLVR